MNKPLLGPCSTYQLEPFVYPWAWDMARQCEHNTWSPEEVPTAPDVMEYRSPNLDQAKRHMFEAVMAQLTTFDIQRGDDAAETFLQILKPAEIKHFLKRLVWEEALHTRSYRFIIENLGMDLEIYDRWEHVPAMKARIDYGNKISDRLMISARHAQDSGHWSLAAKQELLLAMIFWFLIFEGIWFMLNLKGPLQNLARQGNFRGAAEQFQYIARDEDQHVRFGQKLILAFSQQHPEVWDKSTKQAAIELFYDAINLEGDYAKYFLSAGPVLGYSISDHVETAKFFAASQCISLGLPNPYPEAQHRFPWMAEQMELKKEKNFFETRVTDYHTGGALDWGDD